MDLMNASKCVPIHTEKDYQKAKQGILLNYDHAKEYRIGDQLRCKRCKEPTVYDDPAHRLFVRCACKCELEAMEQEKRMLSHRMRAIRFENNENRLGALGKIYENARFGTMTLSDAEDEYIQAVERCERFCGNFSEVKRTGRGIWLWGGVGVGKTHIGACMLHDLEKSNVACIFTSVNRILDEVRATYKSKSQTASDLKYFLSAADVLIVDGMEKVTEGKTDKDAKESARIIAEILQDRLDNRSPTVFLSRISMTDFAANGNMDDGVVDRLAARIVSIRLVGKNRFCEPPRKPEF